ncbi:MAG: GntR family transcriptional regulator [Winogradskyella sp.]|uniref:GntR family transcriptional regulator n=1 Tax=Winogradskyella sp. TaxID=1883156 RepID=UPI000F3D8637|nr:GntR family transcriptional regulator [Winogradskyella sp.]RNC87273.1 MAG: GntR family transcriptional regulator [Winogradskyella sp.]
MITQKSLRSQIIEVVWQLIIDGKIKPNEPLREIHLADMLNVSRTPLREALQQLELEGIVKSEPRKGFRLSDLSEEELKEIYPLRAKLESYALELSGIPSPEQIDELISINHKMDTSNDPKELVELDEIWHGLLISNCKNKSLMKMIKMLHRQSQRYEYAYMDFGNMVKFSISQHAGIIEYLKKGQLKEASILFAENNMVGMDALINSLKLKHNN